MTTSDQKPRRARIRSQVLEVVRIITAWAWFKIQLAPVHGHTAGRCLPLRRLGGSLVSLAIECAPNSVLARTGCLFGDEPVSL